MVTSSRQALNSQQKLCTRYNLLFTGHAEIASPQEGFLYVFLTAASTVALFSWKTKFLSLIGWRILNHLLHPSKRSHALKFARICMHFKILSTFRRVSAVRLTSLCSTIKIILVFIFIYISLYFIYLITFFLFTNQMRNRSIFEMNLKST